LTFEVLGCGLVDSGTWREPSQWSLVVSRPCAPPPVGLPLWSLPLRWRWRLGPFGSSPGVSVAQVGLCKQRLRLSGAPFDSHGLGSGGAATRWQYLALPEMSWLGRAVRSVEVVDPAWRSWWSGLCGWTVDGGRLRVESEYRVLLRSIGEKVRLQARAQTSGESLAVK